MPPRLRPNDLAGPRHPLGVRAVPDEADEGPAGGREPSVRETRLGPARVPWAQIPAPAMRGWPFWVALWLAQIPWIVVALGAGRGLW